MGKRLKRPKGLSSTQALKGETSLKNYRWLELSCKHHISLNIVLCKETRGLALEKNTRNNAENANICMRKKISCNIDVVVSEHLTIHLRLRHSPRCTLVQLILPRYYVSQQYVWLLHNLLPKTLSIHKLTK